MPQIPSVLFVCTGNAGRSQMAQALLRHQTGSAVGIESAGVEPWAALHPMALRVMTAQGIGMEGQRPKSAASLVGRSFDVVVTIGDPALKKLPHALSSPGLWEHWDISDPADADGTSGSQAAFARAAAGIEARLPRLRTLLTAIARRGHRGGGVGLSTTLWPRERFGLTTHLQQLARAGYNAIELCHYQGTHHFDPSDAAAVHDLKHACDDLGVRVWSVHSRDTGSLGSPDPATRQAQIDELLLCLDLCEKLAAKVVVSHGLIVGSWADDPADADGWLEDSLQRLLPDALAGPASIAFENGPMRAAGKMGADVIRRIEPHPAAAFGFVLDPGHSNIAGDLESIARQVGTRLISTHHNDNDGHEDVHWTPTRGSVDWPRVQAIMRDASYGGCVMHEVQANAPGDDPLSALTRTMEKHRELWPDRH